MKHILLSLFFIFLVNFVFSQNIFLEEFKFKTFLKTNHLRKYIYVDSTQNIESIKVYEYSNKDMYQKNKLPKKKGKHISTGIYDKKGRLMQYGYNVKNPNSLFINNQYYIKVEHEDPNKAIFKKFYGKKLLASWSTEANKLTNYTEFKPNDKISIAYSVFYKNSLLEKIIENNSTVVFHTIINEDSTYNTLFYTLENGENLIEKNYYSENKKLIRKDLIYGYKGDFNKIVIKGLENEKIKLKSSESNQYKIFKLDDQNRIIETNTYKNKNDKHKEKETIKYNADGKYIEKTLYIKNKMVRKIKRTFLENGLVSKIEKEVKPRFGLTYEPDFTQQNIYNENGLLEKIIYDTELTKRKYVFTLEYTFYEND